MKSVFWKWTVVLVVGTAGVWFGLRFVLPVALPFLLGALLALAAEPMVSFGVKRLRLPRTLAAGVGVSLSVLLLGGILVVLGAVAVRQMGTLAGKLPDMETALETAKNALLSAAENAPPRLRSLAQKAVHETMEDGAAVVSQLTGQLPGALTSFLSGVGSSALGIGTGLLAAFLISARLPKLRQTLREKLPQSWREKYLPALGRFRSSLWGWFKAQGKLALVTWLIVTVGFWLLKIPKALVWAAAVALVDAVPVLGTGTVLIPWAGISLLQGQSLRAVGLLGVYGVAAITRTVLEPRVVGRQLGLDPLLTLIAMYAGFRFWGIPGMLLTPILASAAKSVMTAG
ncbi:MAG: sporulation integral membrane protein YtvI [Oscillospiraceae bacterium]|nr:sporulation integral membrane protein YtvI [Oscillospiraceae bacterium]